MNIAWNFSSRYDLNGHVSGKEQEENVKNPFMNAMNHIIHISAIPSILHELQMNPNGNSNDIAPYSVG